MNEDPLQYAAWILMKMGYNDKEINDLIKTHGEKFKDLIKKVDRKLEDVKNTIVKNAYEGYLQELKDGIKTSVRATIQVIIQLT